jgi:hypothetical protein
MHKKLFILAATTTISTFAAPATPSSSTTKNSPTPESSIDFFANASFTYWYAKEDGLNVADTATISRLGAVNLPSQSEVFKQSFGYKPGFKVGLGMESKDSWSVGGNYTYYRSTNTTSKSSPSSIGGVSPGVWSLDNWFLQKLPTPAAPNLTATNISSKWKLGMDLGDLSVQKPFALAKTLECSPFAGLRTVWFRQTMNVSITQAAASFGSGTGILPPQPLVSYNNSNAWGIGPRFGTEMRCKLPAGFRLGGLIGASLLYEKFTTVKHSEGQAATIVTLPSFAVSMDYNCIRPVAEMGLGFGWGTSFYDKYNIDLAASYDFSYYWGQNMMRQMLDESISGVATGDKDLYFQGLTITAAFKF